MSTARTAISAGLNAQLREERRQAAVALLRQPLFQPDGANAEVFSLIRRHADWLREWFARHCGWSLQVESEVARLRKTPADTFDATRPLLDSNGQPFSRRRYVVLCLALAVLEKSERQTVLRRLAEDIATRFALEPGFAEAGLTFDVAFRDHRRDLIEVIRYLIHLRVLTKIDGDEQQFLSAQHDVLYTINPVVLAAMPSFRRGPSTIPSGDTESRMEAMLAEPYPDTEDGKNRELRVRLFRRLIDDPVVYYDSLEVAERTYLIPQRPSIAREIESATGLIQESRREGVAMVDADGEMMDIGMPEEGTDGHVTLLVAEYLAGRLRGGNIEAVPVEQIERYIDSLIPTHKSYWRKDVTEPGAASRLVSDAIIRLEKLRLLAWDDGRLAVTALPAIGRFALGTLRVESPGEKALWE